MSDRAAKTGNGTAISPRSGAVIPTGAHPWNTGGKPGRSGARPNYAKELAGHLVQRYQILPMLAAIAVHGTTLADEHLPALPDDAPDIKATDRIKAGEILMGYAFGKPQQHHTVEMTDADRLDRMAELIEIGRKRWIAKQRAKRRAG